ncbi:MAG: glyoxalase [Flavobacteriales bacterium]|nr:glyoxalase [Flavobacteriales bacterium]
MKRDKQVVELRPVINTINSELVRTDQEKFQNEVIRPIIKFQHELIVKIFCKYLQKKNIDLASMSKENKVLKITSVFKNDRLLVNELKCIIIAYFTSSEYENYSSMKSEINKRLTQIIKERIHSVLVCN